MGVLIEETVVRLLKASLPMLMANVEVEARAEKMTGRWVAGSMDHG